MQSIDKIVSDAQAAFEAAPSVADLEQAKSRFLGKSGALTELLKGLGKLPPEEKPSAGAAINEAKVRVEGLLLARRDAILAAELDQRLAAEAIDVTLPGRRQSGGGLHPISRSQERIERLFASMGFSVADGPEIENDFFNFTALRMFPDHPSRSMQDTFYVADSDKVLRTHTSPVQIRFMQAHEPPIRIICPGRVYRVDHDATHSPMFHQIEGLWVDEGVSLADLKGTLVQFLRAFFEREDIEVRFRPSYFPFVEPGVEIDMAWERKGGEASYLEIGGAGVVHPDVLKYGVNDLRLFFDNDVKFLRQFR
jgi:phenylalanyl-tRNA synthetase alpha chain